MIGIVGRTYKEARLGKTVYLAIYDELATARPLSSYEPFEVMGRTFEKVYVLPGARSGSFGARTLFRLLGDTELVELLPLACRCLSRCTEGDDAPGCPGDDGSWGHCSGCGHARDETVMPSEIEVA